MSTLSPPDNHAIDRAFIAAVKQFTGLPLPSSALDGDLLVELFDSQAKSRHLDFAGRRLRAQNKGYYTIGSSGHESNAAVAAALRPDDPAFLHYRSGAFFVQRAKQTEVGDSALMHVLLGMVASRDEPMAGGRHKVFGSKALAIWPQTSTIASHLPKAVGMAFALERKKRMHVAGDTTKDAIVVCSFGDASANHSTATGAINTACFIAQQGLFVPLLLVCEDNGLGISTPTPPDWIESAYGGREGLSYFFADGRDLRVTYQTASEAVGHVRATRKPGFLHLRTVRLMGHAGSDVELSYRSKTEIAADEARDPLIASARQLVDAGILSVAEILARYESIRVQVLGLAEQAAARPKLRDAADVMVPLAPRTPRAVTAASATDRQAFWQNRLPESEGPLPLGPHINRALGDLLVQHPEALIFGEDVARKGGVYGITRGLAGKAGALRVFDTVLDEQTILGLAIGCGQAKLLPICEIQYLAYVHNALDQLRGEASTLSFFSQAQFQNPMVVRMASYAYQKGFGGHFHNDNSIGALRDIPGLVIASPSRGDDAAAMLRTCVAAGKQDGTVSAFLEPIALYNTRDLHAEGDGKWCADYAPEFYVPLGEARVYGEGDDLLLVSFANGVPMSLRVARQLQAAHGVRCRVLDLRWIAPLPIADLIREASACQATLVVDETRRTGGVSEGIITALVDANVNKPIARVAAKDSFIPLGDAADFVLVGEDDIEQAALALVQG